MAKINPKKKDEILTALEKALREYERRYKESEASVYRYNPGSIRIRIIDDRFKKMSRAKRHDTLWEFLNKRVGEDSMCEVTLLLLLTRDELRASIMNHEFNHRSRIAV